MPQDTYILLFIYLFILTTTTNNGTCIKKVVHSNHFIPIDMCGICVRVRDLFHHYIQFYCLDEWIYIYHVHFFPINEFHANDGCSLKPFSFEQRDYYSFEFPWFAMIYLQTENFQECADLFSFNYIQFQVCLMNRSIHNTEKLQTNRSSSSSDILRAIPAFFLKKT